MAEVYNAESLLSTPVTGFPSVEEANDDVALYSDEVGTPTPAQMTLDVVGEGYVSTYNHCYPIAVDSDDVSEIKLERKHPEGSRKFRISLNVPQEEPDAKCPISRDEVHFSQARRDIRRNPLQLDIFFVFRLQTGINKDNQKNLTSGSMAEHEQKDWRHNRCERKTSKFTLSKSVSQKRLGILKSFGFKGVKYLHEAGY
ncbi:DNA-binding HORMA [Penicillium coprophilum]|uniref:DNA-binding HORMA n=1 Tax=Penicillium coprophilum TaxID=36646 RepID=UPI00239AB3BA|nr:DNA-binding HORMA [Penicillium coprophilum]KAJ5169823.1 DNA-binding HORMA [Penicillium coprophilum]